MLHVLYLAHDLSDAAVRRRVSMLRTGGARVSVAGFRRTAEPVRLVDGEPAIDLGRTEDGAFGKRIGRVVAAAVGLKAKLGGLRPDVVVARNMEMLALALRVKGSDVSPRIVYESLDIHRMLLRRDMVGTAMRHVEAALMRRASLLVTSSPAFVRGYFQPIQKTSLPILLVENKVLDLEGTNGVEAVASSASRPLTIGWFGALRCAKSLRLLAETARLMEGRIEVVLRGRPAHREFDDFEGAVRASPHLRFEGPYKSPEDLACIYGAVDLVWAIDFFEEGLNSRWLLPNRLYEGCLNGRVPIAMRGTETARYLETRGIGLVLDEATPEALRDLLTPLLAGAALASARSCVAAVDRSDFVCGRAECEELVRALGASPASSGARRDWSQEAASA